MNAHLSVDHFQFSLLGGCNKVFFKALSTVYESKIKSKGAPIALWYVYVQITNESVNGVYYNNFRYGCLACCAHRWVWS